MKLHDISGSLGQVELFQLMGNPGLVNMSQEVKGMELAQTN